MNEGHTLTGGAVLRISRTLDEVDRHLQIGGHRVRPEPTVWSNPQPCQIVSVVSDIPKATVSAGTITAMEGTVRRFIRKHDDTIDRPKSTQDLTFTAWNYGGKLLAGELCKLWHDSLGDGWLERISASRIYADAIDYFCEDTLEVSANNVRGIDGIFVLEEPVIIQNIRGWWGPAGATFSAEINLDGKWDEYQLDCHDEPAECTSA